MPPAQAGGTTAGTTGGGRQRSKGVAAVILFFIAGVGAGTAAIMLSARLRGPPGRPPSTGPAAAQGGALALRAVNPARASVLGPLSTWAKAGGGAHADPAWRALWAHKVPAVGVAKALRPSVGGALGRAIEEAHRRLAPVHARVFAHSPSAARWLTDALRATANNLHDWWWRHLQARFPDCTLSPFGGTLHQVLRYGTLFGEPNYDAKFVDGGVIDFGAFDTDVDAMIVCAAPVARRDRRGAFAALHRAVNASLVAHRVCARPPQRRGMVLMCKLAGRRVHGGRESQHADILVVLNVEGYLHAGRFADTPSHRMPFSAYHPPKPCLLDRAVWMCPRDSTAFQSNWERGEYTTRSGNTTCLWQPPYQPRLDAVLPLTRRSIRTLHDSGFHSYFPEMTRRPPTCPTRRKRRRRPAVPARPSGPIAVLKSIFLGRAAVAPPAAGDEDDYDYDGDPE